MVIRIVDGGEDVGVHVVDRFAFENRLREAFGNFVAVADFILPVLERGRSGGWRFDFCAERGSEDAGLVSGEAEDDFAEIFFGGGAAGAALKVVLVDAAHGLELEVAFADEHYAGFDSVDGERER